MILPTVTIGNATVRNHYRPRESNDSRSWVSIESPHGSLHMAHPSGGPDCKRVMDAAVARIKADGSDWLADDRASADWVIAIGMNRPPFISWHRSLP